MKIFLLSAMFAGMCGGVLAQTAQTAFVVNPYISTRDLSNSRFWTHSTMALAAIDGAAKTADSIFTRKNIDGGGNEYNPLARPFVHTTGVQIAGMAAMFAAELGGAYLLHRRRHDVLGHALLGIGAVTNGLGAACSFKNRVPSW
jgi:hypothetical protein